MQRLPSRIVILTVLLSALVASRTSAAQAPSIAGAQPSAPAQALAEARRLAANGEWEAAVEVYRPLLADGGDAGLTGRFELARLYDRLDREQDAADLLAGLLNEPATAEPVVRGWFLQGSVQQQLGNRLGALAAYARYIELGGPAAGFARVAQARIFAADDRETALDTLAPLVNGAGPAPARRQALQLAGDLEAGAERYDRAVARYTELLNVATSSAERIAALNSLGATQARLGNTDAAVESLRTLAGRYPFAAEAEQALDRLAELGRPADPLTAGIVHYRRRNNQQARDLFNAYLRDNGAAGPGAATALFYLGALAVRRDDTRLALENYDEAFRADPGGSLAVESLWERARVLQDAGRADDARGVYTLLAGRFPGSRRAPDAAFLAGYILYMAGGGAQARDAWTAALAGREGEDAARAAFWAGRVAGELGDAAGARQSYAEAARRSPTGYYGLRAAAVLAGEPGAPPARRSGGAFSVPLPDWAQAESWLAGWAGAEDPGLWLSISGSEDWRGGLELLQLGLHRTGTDTIGQVIDGSSDQPWALYRTARALDAAGQPHLAYAAAGRLLAAAPASASTALAAAAIARLAYPAPWPDIVQYFAGQYGVDPLLLYAVIRQESAFNPLAGSSAGAFGLTQVIRPTAGDIARALGKDPFAFGDLARPIIAIQFGAYYTGAQVRAFGGSVYQALAAYNGGAGNAARWERAGGRTDVDRFFEEIDFTETRSYLRLVLQNYAWYRYLYGGAARPSLTSSGQ